MLNLIDVLLAGLALIILAFTFTWWQAGRAGRPVHGRPAPLPLLVGFITLFFDTLGIGNYAPTTAFFKLTGMVRDEMIPGTLNVGSSIPVAFEAFAFMVAVAVDPVTIALLVPVGTMGGWFGGQVVSRLPRRAIQIGMGLALLVGAAFMLMTNLKMLPGGGDAIGFSRSAPVMRFVRAGRFDGTVALALTLGGIPGVLIAAYVVKSLPVETIRWLVVAVVLYASMSMLTASRKAAETEIAEARPL